MKHLVATFLFLISFCCIAQINSVSIYASDDGTEVILYNNGTWRYADSEVVKIDHLKKAKDNLNSFFLEYYYSVEKRPLKMSVFERNYEVLFDNYKKTEVNDWEIDTVYYECRDILVELKYNEPPPEPNKPLNKNMKFILTNINDVWKIKDSYGFLLINLSLRKDDSDNIAWDSQKHQTLKDLENNR